MTLVDFLNTEVDDMSESDIYNALFMRDLIEYEDYHINNISDVSISESLLKSLDTFNIYKSDNLNNQISIMKKEIKYIPYYMEPFQFSTQMVIGKDSEIIPTIVYPYNLDKASYVFFGHEFHHAIKDVNCTERKIRDRVAEVIPMFYEMMCASSETDEDVSKEILKRRLILLQHDKEEETDDIVRQLQYFNSYYYALALYNKYKKDKLLILRLISRVLTGEINTLDMLKMLGLYENDLDYKVSRELYMVKEYVLR